jgi:hypothetical protein
MSHDLICCRRAKSHDPQGNLSASDAALPADDIKLLFLSVNEGGNALSSSVQSKVLQDLLASRQDICGVAVARQEGVLSGAWDAALAEAGFSEKVIDERKPSQGQLGTTFSLYARPAEDLQLLDFFTAASVDHEKSELSNKGGVIAVVKWRGLRICLGGFHLDGNLASLEARTGQLPAAVLRAWARAGEDDIDVAIFAGDINCTLDPGKTSSDSHECGQLLSADIASLRGVSKDRAQQELGSTTQEKLKAALATCDGRVSLQQTLDSNPSKLVVDPTCLQYDLNWSPEEDKLDKIASCSIKELLLYDVLKGSFPSYRLTTRDGKGAGSALKVHTGDSDEEVQHLYPHMDVSLECIHDCYFADEKAGILKKRGDMIRLNLGWLERLYYGFKKVEGSPTVELQIEQRNPLVLRASSGETLDHALVPWTLSIKRRIE